MDENKVQQNIGMKLMTVRIIQSENKRPYSSYVTVGKLAEWMGCEKSEVELLLDYTSEFDDMVLTRNVIRKCQKQKLISCDNEIIYYTWFLMCYGKIFADKDKERDIVTYARKVDSEFLKNFACEIPTSAEDNGYFNTILKIYRKHLYELITNARSAGVEDIVIEQMLNRTI